MQNAMYTGVFASLSTEHRMAIISNNLANVNTTGYKQDKLAFKDTMLNFAHDFIREPLEHVRHKPLFPEQQNRSRVRLAVSEIDFSQGSMVYTGNNLDVAIAGDGFFRIETPNGPFLSRNGNFVRSGDGTLTTKQGWPVQGMGGPINIPANARHVDINSEGRVFVDGAEVGQFNITMVDDARKLEHVGGNLFRPRAGVEVEEMDPRATGTLINQGYTEAANVNVVTEMVNMIEVHRHFEATNKIIQTSDSLDREAITKVGRNR